MIEKNKTIDTKNTVSSPEKLSKSEQTILGDAIVGIKNNPVPILDVMKKIMSSMN